MKKSKNYYHATAVENVDAILKEGLKSSTGEIFLVDQPNVLGSVVFNQLFLDEYAVFSVSVKGIDKLINDGVAEYTSKNQFIATQKSISPEHIKFVKEVKPNMLFTTIRENLRILMIFRRAGEDKVFDDILRMIKGNSFLNDMLNEYPNLDYKTFIKLEKEYLS